jgi:hypothetical protein
MLSKILLSSVYGVGTLLILTQISEGPHIRGFPDGNRSSVKLAGIKRT